MVQRVFEHGLNALHMCPVMHLLKACWFVYATMRVGAWFCRFVYGSMFEHGCNETCEFEQGFADLFMIQCVLAVMNCICVQTRTR